MAGQKTQKQSKTQNTPTPKTQNRFGNDQKNGNDKKPSDGLEQPAYALDITEGFNPDENWTEFFKAFKKKKGSKYAEIPVILPGLAQGILKARLVKAPKDKPATFKLDAGKQQGIPINHLPFLGEIPGLTPVVAIDMDSKGVLSKFMSFAVGEKGRILPDDKKIVADINKNLEPLGIKGFTPLTGDIENEVVGNKLKFKINNFTTTIDGFVEATGSLGVHGDKAIFDVQAKIDVKGMAEGNLEISRNEKGQILGKAEIEAVVANMKGKLIVIYDNGAISIKGTASYESEKFSGSITLLVTDAAAADEATNSELGGALLTMPKPPAEGETKGSTKTKANQVLVGWGDVKAQITPWLDGEAKIIVNKDGHVTITGKVTPAQGDIELMEKKEKTIPIFDFTVKYFYGIPLLGNVFIRGGIAMDFIAAFGPLLLRNVAMEGTYSTDPNVAQSFSITGDLNISAYAALRLTAKVEAGLTFLGHDVGAGIEGYAGLGLETYAQATPTFLYEEKMTDGGKVGESHLKGRLEAAAQLVLKLGGNVYLFVDAPWWSPVPDKKWKEPLGEVTYPIGDSIGIAAEVDWLVGSPEIPELKMDEVDFDPGKFTGDIMEDPPKVGGSDKKKKKGTWEDKSGDGKEGGDGKNSEGKEKPLTDEQKYTKALSELESFAGENEKGNIREVPKKVLLSKMKRVKSKYGIETIKLDKTFWGTPYIYVKHKKRNNKDHLLYVKFSSDSDHRKKIEGAKFALDLLSRAAVDKDNTITKAKATKIANKVAKDYDVVEKVIVIDGGASWNYGLDDGGSKLHTKKGFNKTENKVPEVKPIEKPIPTDTEKPKDDKKKKDKKTPDKVVDPDGKKLPVLKDNEAKPEKKTKEKEKKEAKKEKIGDGEIGKVVSIVTKSGKHRIWVRISGKKAIVILASREMNLNKKLKFWDDILSKEDIEAPKVLKDKKAVLKAKKLLISAKNHSDIVKKESEKAIDILEETQFVKVDNKIESEENDLGNIVKELYDLFIVVEFGHDFRDVDVDPDKAAEDPATLERQRWDDAPIVAQFSKNYNKLENWYITSKTKFGKQKEKFESFEAIESTFVKLTKTGVKTPNERITVNTRAELVASVKNRTKYYKTKIRNFGAGKINIDEIDQAFKDDVGVKIAEINSLVTKIKDWYQTHEDEVPSEENVHDAGEKQWRDAWLEAIETVNKILLKEWPSTRSSLVSFANDHKSEIKISDNNYYIGKLTYIGSLARGVKGPPKQNIRFNPFEYDVDANLDAPPLAYYAAIINKRLPDRGRIFGRESGIKIMKDFAVKIENKLIAAKISPPGNDDPFDVVLDANTIEQDQYQAGAQVLNELRNVLDAEQFANLISEVEKKGLIDSEGKLKEVIDKDGNALPILYLNDFRKLKSIIEDPDIVPLTREQYDKVQYITDRDVNKFPLE